ncbi:MAG: parallel beta-helix repeat protein, partial [Lentimonas sp.]
RGIHLRSDHNSKQNSKISDNDISNNSAAGIRIASADFSSQNNEISRNSISNNLQDGIRLIYNSDNIFNIKLQNNNMNDNTGFDLRSVLYASSTTPIIDLGVGSLGSLGGNSFNRVVGFYKEAPDTISISAKNNYWGLGSSTLINGFNTIDDSDKLLSNPFID